MLRHRRRVYTPKPIREWKGPKPKLPMLVDFHCRVHFRALEAYLAKVYRMQDYDVRLATGVRGDMVPEFLVTGELPPAANMGQQADNIRRGRRTRDLGLILNVLCVDGFIPVGMYAIDTIEDQTPIHTYAELLNRNYDPLHPTCIALREKHRHDKDFMKRAKELERLVLEAKRQVEENTDV